MRLKGTDFIPKDEVQALMWLTLAAQRGDLTAAIVLKKMAQ